MRKLSEINLGPVAFLVIYQVLLFAALPFYFYYSPPSLAMVGISVVFLFLTGLSITGGYHRYFSHRSWKTNSIVETVLLFFGSMAGQGSALRWSFDHRLHHAHVDTDEDPYSIKKGFWYAHCWWLVDKPRPITQKVVPDLLKNKRVMFQDKHNDSLMVLTNAIAFFFIGWLLDDYLGAFFIGLWLRLCALHHFTWFINSLAHTWGDKPFCQEQTAVNNWIISLLTFGEGYHNYHHAFANDYRNGVRWYHYDPTKWLIWTLNKLKLAKQLRQMDELTIKKRMVVERKNLLLEQIKNHWHTQKEELTNSVQEHSEKMLQNISSFSTLEEKYQKIKKERSEKDLLKELKQELHKLKEKIQSDWKVWHKLSANIMRRRQPLPAH